jgi:hypothetical protein
MRVSTFQAVSPWRIANMRVISMRESLSRIFAVGQKMVQNSTVVLF